MPNTNVVCKLFTSIAVNPLQVDSKHKRALTPAAATADDISMSGSASSSAGPANPKRTNKRKAPDTEHDDGNGGAPTAPALRAAADPPFPSALPLTTPAESPADAKKRDERRDKIREAVQARKSDVKEGVATGQPIGKYKQVLDTLTPAARKRFVDRVQMMADHNVFPSCPKEMKHPSGCSMGFLGHCKTTRNFCGACSEAAGDLVSVCHYCKQLHAILANPELIKLFASEDNSAAAAAAQQQPSSSSSSSSPAPAPASAVAAAGVPDDDTDLARLQAVVKKLRVRYQANENPDDDAFKHPLVEPFHSTRDVDDFIRSHLNTPVAQLATWRWDDQYPEQAIAVLLDVSRGVTQHLEQLYAQAREQAIYRGREFHRRQHLKNSNYDVRLVIGACATHARALDKAYKEGNFDVEEPHFLFRELQEYLAWLNGPTAEAVGEFLSLEKLEHDRDDKAAQEDAKNAAAEAAAEAAAAAIADPVAHAQETAVARLSSRQLSLYDISNIHWLYEEHTRYKNTRPRDLNEAALKERTRFYKLYQPALDYYESNPAAKEAAIAEGDEVHRKFADSLVGCDVKYYQKHREDPVYDHWSTYKKTVANWGASRAIVPPKDKFNVDDDHPAPAGSS